MKVYQQTINWGNNERFLFFFRKENSQEVIEEYFYTLNKTQGKTTNLADSNYNELTTKG